MLSAFYTKSVCLSLLLWIGGTALAQKDFQRIGDWTSYLPYKYAISVTQSDERVFYATPFAVLGVDKEEGSTVRYSTVDGLSDTDIELLKYNPVADELLIVYTDGVFDILTAEGEVFTVFDIKNYEGIIGTKRVDAVRVDETGRVYLVGNFGLTQFDPATRTFVATTVTGVETTDVAVYNDELYLATAEGIYRTPRTNPNQDVFATWTAWQPPGLPSDFSTRALAAFDGSLAFDAAGALWRYTAGAPTVPLYALDDRFVAYLSAEGERLLAGLACANYNGCSATTLAFRPDNSFVGAGPGCVSRPLGAVEDEAGRIWYADGFQEFRRGDFDSLFCDRRTYNTPLSHNSTDIHVADGNVYVASGGTDVVGGYLFRKDGFFTFIDGEWKAYNSINTPALDTDNGKFDDIWKITTHPETGVVYAGSYLEGLIEFDGENFTTYNNTNSTLGEADEGRYRVSGLQFDAENRLWVSNYLSDAPLSVLSPTGEWQAFTPPGNVTLLRDIAVDGSGNKWIALGDDSRGLLIFNEGDPADPADDRWRVLTSTNSELPSNQVGAVVADLNGDIWAGTGEGAVVFQCGTDPFSPEFCSGFRPRFVQDGIPAFLLESENVQALAIDGANRKWFGTTNGIFVLSPDGQELIQSFNVDNSPLFANGITALAVDDANGRVWIGTDRGIQTYQADAVEGRVALSDVLTVYPNPVRPDYTGPIAIDGLTRDADVKITDISGQLVYAGTSIGGRAVWDGRDYNGRRVSTGVYLIYATDTRRPDKPAASIGKIMFIN